MIKGGKPVVLVVEDDEPIRNLITTTLEMEKYKFDTAQNGSQAIMLAAANNPDIILMDLGLPDMDGIEVIRKIRSWSVAPIIVISARSDEKDKVAALDVGADDYLTKPFSVVELSARLRATIRRVQYIMREDNTNESVFKNGGLEIDYSA
ncbi:MAG: response regulator, partial [Eubacteriales bacterium]|nr:response regulator [Eubacteriales bacterium]